MIRWTEIVIDVRSPLAKRRIERGAGDMAAEATGYFGAILGANVGADSWTAPLLDSGVEVLAFAPAPGVLAATWRLDDSEEGEALACSIYLAGSDAEADAEAVRHYQAEIVAPLATAFRVGPLRDLIDESARPLLCTTLIPPRRPVPDKREMAARSIVAQVESWLAAAFFTRALTIDRA